MITPDKVKNSSFLYSKLLCVHLCVFLDYGLGHLTVGLDLLLAPVSL